jgi:hypothetical protein
MFHGSAAAMRTMYAEVLVFMQRLLMCCTTPLSEPTWMWYAVAALCAEGQSKSCLDVVRRDAKHNSHISLRVFPVAQRDG